MDMEHTQRDGAGSPAGPGGNSGRPRVSRRQALGRMSAVAGAGAAAWMVPEILTAKPAAGATMSVGPGTTGTPGGPGTPGTTGTPGTPRQHPGTDGTTPTGGVATEPATTSNTNPTTGTGGVAPATTSGSLAFTGLNIQRDAEVGAALVAGGWAMQHWASRTPKVATDGPTETHEAGSAGDSA